MSQILNGTYEVLEFIGSGGMSTVFRARHIRLNIDVAVKCVRKSQTVNLLAEINILTKLNHPNLVRVIDIFEDDTLLYIVMDLIAGEDLQSVINRVKTIPESQLIEWFKTMADTLRYLHTRTPKIIYRDMKPSNIILQKDGSLKLIDFGIAREYKASKEGDTMFVGTNGFAAPEQFGLAQSDERTDIYSLGMTMYYLATGKSPYTPPHGYVPARQINPAVSPKLEKILDRCVKVDPRARYQNADELLKDLKGIKSSASGTAYPAGGGSSSRSREAGPHFYKGGDLNAPVHSGNPADGQTAVQQPQLIQDDRSSQWLILLAVVLLVFAGILAIYFLVNA